MNFSEVMAVLDRKKPLGMTFGTDKLAAVLQKAGISLGGIPFVHIAGTNGKGSVAAMVASIAQAAGLRVGLFTSPSLFGVRGDILLGGEPISEAAFAEAAERLLTQEADGAPLSYFELETGIALTAFEAHKPDVCIVECGLGGKDDATNVIPSPAVAVFTAISLDHTALLGGTVREITAAKCGILKPGTVAVTSPHQHPEALEEILRQAARSGITVEIPAEEAVLADKEKGLELSLGGQVYTISSHNRRQSENAALAITAARVLARRLPVITEQAIQNGLKAAAFPCRQEWISCRPIRILDGGHNPAAAAAFADSLTLWGIRSAVLLTGMMADKDIAAYARSVAPFCRKVICTAPPNPRAADPAALADIYRSLGVEAIAIPAPEQALLAARKEAGDDPLIVAGSFYLCAVIRPILTE